MGDEVRATIDDLTTGYRRHAGLSILDRLPVNPETGCWEWQGKRSNGYGQTSLGNRMVYVHRLTYLVYVGPVPDGLEIDHLCRVRHCANPAHLEAVTAKVNVNRGINHESEKTHCPQGHPYAGENLYVNPSSGNRACRSCHRRHQVAYTARRRDRRL